MNLKDLKIFKEFITLGDFLISKLPHPKDFVRLVVNTDFFLIYCINEIKDTFSIFSLEVEDVSDEFENFPQYQAFLLIESIIESKVKQIEQSKELIDMTSYAQLVQCFIEHSFTYGNSIQELALDVFYQDDNIFGMEYLAPMFDKPSFLVFFREDFKSEMEKYKEIIKKAMKTILKGG